MKKLFLLAVVLMGMTLVACDGGAATPEKAAENFVVSCFKEAPDNTLKMCVTKGSVNEGKSLVAKFARKMGKISNLPYSTEIKILSTQNHGSKADVNIDVIIGGHKGNTFTVPLLKEGSSWKVDLDLLSRNYKLR